MNAKTDYKGFDQKKRKLLLLICAPFLLALILFTRPIWQADTLAVTIAKQLGAICVFLCIMGRCWAILYIGSRKNDELVQTGPYQYTRNPLYVASAIGMMGVGLLMGSYLLGIFLFVFTWIAFSWVIKNESRDLTHFFGETYKQYCASVPAFFPRFSSSQPAPTKTDRLEFAPKLLGTTFRDASLFLLILPLSEFIDWLHKAGYFKTLLNLY